MKLLALPACAIALVISHAALAQQNLSGETATPGGGPHLLATNLSEAAAQAGVANIQLQTGQTLTNVVQNVASGTTDVGNAPLVLTFLLKLGRGPYSSLGKKGAGLAANLRALYPYRVGAYTLFGFQSAGITGWDQLKGKTIYNGPPRGGALVGARQMIQIVAGLKDGVGYKGIQVNWGQANKTIADGSADMNLLPLSAPSDRIAAGLAAGKMRILSVPKETFESDAFQRWARSPGNAPMTMKVSDMGYGDDVEVVSEDGLFRGVTITGADIVHKDMSNKTAKGLTQAFIASMKTLVKKTPWAKNMGVGVLDAKASGFCGPVPLKYHPGAIAAWEEAGYKVPDCAKP